MEGKKTNSNLKWLKMNFVQAPFFPAIIIFLSTFSAPSLVNAGPTRAQLLGQQYYWDPCNYPDKNDEKGVPINKCNEAHGLSCNAGFKCICRSADVPGFRRSVERVWDPEYAFHNKTDVTLPGFCVYGQNGPCKGDRDCISGLQCQRKSHCSQGGVRQLNEPCFPAPHPEYCLKGRNLDCTDKVPGMWRKECRCTTGWWNNDVEFKNDMNGKCQIQEGEKCGKDIQPNWPDAPFLDEVECWDGTACVHQDGFYKCVKFEDIITTTTTTPKPKVTKKTTPKPKLKFIDTSCKNDCDQVDGDVRFLFCHHGKCECLPSPKKGDQVPTMWDQSMVIPGLNETGQCVIKDYFDCRNHILPYSCRTKFVCGEKGKCIPEPTYINEPCKDTCDHVQGDERFLTCHSGKCNCLPSTKFSDKDKKKIKQVLTEWDAKKQVQNMTYQGQCAIQEDQDCHGHILPIECKTGLYCNDKGRCAKEPTFINEPCKDSCDHVEGDDRFLTCHSGKCVCLPSTKFADQSKKKLVQVQTEWDPLKVVNGSKTKFKGQCVVKNGQDCKDHLMPYECRTRLICRTDGTCGLPAPEKVKFIKERCTSTCDHVNGGDRFLTCHNGECSCLPSMRYSDKGKKKIQKVPTEWDKSKPVDGLADPGQCVIKGGSECEDHVLPYSCKTGFTCGGKGTCEKSSGTEKKHNLVKTKRMARYRRALVRQ